MARCTIIIIASSREDTYAKSLASFRATFMDRDSKRRIQHPP
jgi:hypothetical protein